jgi:hypothetical protein
MTPEEKNPQVHHQTVRAARNALAKKQISRGSYGAVLAGTLSLSDAKRLGRDGGPTPADAREGQDEGQETSQSASAQEGAGTPPHDQRLCLCGCGEPVRGKKSRFRPGHDARLHGELKRNLKADPLLRYEHFTEEQREYARERGLI